MGKKAQAKRVRRDAKIVPSANAFLARKFPPRIIRVMPEWKAPYTPWQPAQVVNNEVEN